MTRTDNPWGGTGYSFSQLTEMKPPERHEVLVSALALLRSRLDAVKQQVQECEGMIREDMQRDGATLLRAAGFEVTLKPKYAPWQYDVEGLSQLQGFVPADDFERAVKVVTEVKVNKTELNKLAKTGGEAHAIIDQSSWQKLIGFDIVLKPQ